MTDAEYVREARAVLRKCEWSAADSLHNQCCPECNGIKDEDTNIPDSWRGTTTIGHEPDCRLAALLR